MINQQDTIQYDKIGFDSNKYIDLQYKQILERKSKFNGRLYLEIGGKFLYDSHASRVLPGFKPDSKKIIFEKLKNDIEILFCINAKDLESNRQLSNQDIDYKDYISSMIKKIEKELQIKPMVVVNMIDNENRKLPPGCPSGYKVWRRYLIDGYPESDIVLSDNGYGKDEYINLEKKLILVTGAASNSGKMSTCLGQIYLDNQNGIKSGYAKYETFPIWNLPLGHPVNLAYEAATADIGDFNVLDPYHQKEYKQQSVNYNRDVEAFKIVDSIAKKIVNHKNYMRKYKSPTDMGINCVGFAIENDKTVCLASVEEIKRRKNWYMQIVDRGEGKQEWIKKCNDLYRKAKNYCKKKNYL